MSEFRRASTSVGNLEEQVAALLAAVAASGGSAAAAGLPEEARAGYSEASRQLAELEPVAEKMRRKCQARGDLELLKEELRRQVPGAPEDVLKVLQEMLDAEDEAAKALKPLLDKALELDGIATYGVKMVEKVQELLVRFDAVRARFHSEVAPGLSGAVAAADADEAARKASAEQAAREEARRAEQEAKLAVAQVMAENEKKLEALRQEQEAAERQRALEEAQRLRVEAAVAAELEALRREEAGQEQRLQDLGPDSACAEGLVMLLAQTVGTYREVLSGLQGIIGAVAAEPADARRRVIRLANQAFQEKLGCRPGAWLFLRACGFAPCTREALPRALAAALGLGEGSAAERFLVLEEPDMMGAYEAWTSWHDRLTSIAAFLEELERIAFQRSAPLGRHGLDAAMQTLLAATEVLQRWEARQK